MSRVVGTSEPPRGRLTEEQHRSLTAAVVRRAVEVGTIPEAEAQAWTNELTLDFWSALHALDALPDGAHPPITAAAPRPRREDGESIVARGVQERRIPASRRDFWLARHREAPEEVERLMTSPPEAGGLVALPVAAAGVAASPTAEESEHRAAFAATFTREAAALGYAVPGRPARIVDRS